MINEHVTAEELQADLSPIQRFVKGVRHFDATFEVEGLVFAKIYVPLDKGMSVLQSAAGSFLLKKLSSRLHSIEVEFYSKKVKVRFLSHPLGDLEVRYAPHL